MEQSLRVVTRVAALALVDYAQLDTVGGFQCVVESFGSTMRNPFFHESLAYSLFAMFVAPYCF